MNKLMSMLEKILMPLAEKIGKNKYLISIRDGFLISSPLLIVGSFFLLIANFPIPGWSEFWANILGQGWESHFSRPVAATFDVMAILAVIGIAYAFAKQLKVDALAGAAIALVAFFILTPFQKEFIPAGSDVAEIVTGVIPLGWMGSKGLFVGMLVSFMSVGIFAWVFKKGWVIKLPEGVPPTVEKSFAALIPSAVVMTIFFVIAWIFTLTPAGSVHDVVFKFLQLPLQQVGGSLSAMVIAYIFLHLFWFFGINGGSVVGAVYNPILKALSAENLEAFQAGTELPNIVNGQFQDLFATFGGAGSTLSLLIAMLFMCKSERIKSLGKLAFLPGVFGINEPIVFGLPIMLNPMLLIPFMLVPTLNIIITYFCMSSGLVPLTNGVQIPWTTPIIVSGFLATGWRGAVLQALLFVMGIVIYIPFIKMVDKQYLKEEEDNRKMQEAGGDSLSFDDLTF